MTTDLESRIATVVQGRAAEAMNATDTSAELLELQERLAHEREGVAPRRALVTTAAALAAAAMVLGVTWLGGVGHVPDRWPLDDGRPYQDPAAQVAQEFAEAFADGDNARIASMLDDESASPPGWQNYAKLADAWSVEYELHQCQTISVTNFAANVGCGFDIHALHSEELGLGPFGDNYMSVVVRDGKVRWFSVVYNSNLNGASELYVSLAKWIEKNHPEDWEFLDNGWGFTELGAIPQSEVPRWIWLWQRYSAQYADEMAAQTQR